MPALVSYAGSTARATPRGIHEQRELVVEAI